MPTQKRRVRVVAALIEQVDQGKVLITQRRPQSFMPLKWEFPGGKVEPGESDAQALARELREELGIEVDVGIEFLGMVHSYPEFDIDFHVYRCSLVSGEIHCIGVHNYCWVNLSELDKFEFPPADQPTVSQLIANPKR
jgi:8-oxo-dGTP diphosphatase